MKLKFNKSLFYLVFSFVPLTLIVLYGGSQLIAAYSSEENFKNLLVLDTETLKEYYQPKISWKIGETEGGWDIDPDALIKVSTDYVASYYYQFQATKVHDTKGLNDYYTDLSKADMVALSEWSKQNDQSSSGTCISHEATLDFYSADGTIINLTDRVVSYQLQKMGGKEISRGYDTSTFKVMLILEDNYWRIRHKLRVENDTIPLPRNPSPNIAFAQDYRIRGINYYPKKHPWQEMWVHFDSIDFRSDFKKIVELGFNTLRIFVPYHHFGGSQVKEREMKNLVSLLDLSHEQGLKVVLTLFDFFLGYPIEEWSVSDRHLESIVARTARHPALLMYDLKNEPDLDFESSGEKEVLAWLDFISKRLSVYDSSARKTVGWSQPEYAHLMQDELDMLSFHFYRDVSELSLFLDTVSLDKPLFIGETGMHAYSKWWFPFSKNRKDQYEYYDKVLKVIDSHCLHYAFWTLYDFKKIPSNVAGAYPWQKGPQKSFGIQQKKLLELIKKMNQNSYEK